MSTIATLCGEEDTCLVIESALRMAYHAML